MATRHAWELPGHSWEQGQALEDDLHWGHVDSDSDADEIGSSNSDNFIQFMISLLLTRTLNCKQFCIAMYWANLGGISAAKKFGFRPGAPSGHYSRHLRTVLSDSTRRGFYNISVPGLSRSDMSRSAHTIPVQPPHETLPYDVLANDGGITRLREVVNSKTLPPSYYTNPVVQQNPDELVIPISVYLDFVPYAVNDSILGIWIHNMSNDRRYLFAVYRKRYACQCGCKAWCSIFVLLETLAWSLRALAKGEWPNCRHDHEAWTSDDAVRSSRAFEKLPFKAAVCFIKGDWSEFAHSMGVPSWQHSLRPCFGCNGFGADLMNSEDCTPSGLRWTSNTAVAHEEACSRCETHIVITDENRDVIAARLAYDKRERGGRGRCLTRSIPELNLQLGDRLEPNSNLGDVSRFEELPVGKTVVFWRMGMESMVKHRNPLWDPALGLSIISLSVDVLHAVYLGIMNTWCSLAA